MTVAAYEQLRTMDWLRQHTEQCQACDPSHGIYCRVAEKPAERLYELRLEAVQRERLAWRVGER